MAGVINQPSSESLDAVWEEHSLRWRNPIQICSQWEDAEKLGAELFDFKVSGDFWSILDETKATLFISREYEHFVIALSVLNSKPRISYLAMPHPSGIACNRKTGEVYVASTRNPNQLYLLRGIVSVFDRSDLSISSEMKAELGRLRPLSPAQTWFYPGSLYVHDIALGDDGEVYANLVAHNSVGALNKDGSFSRLWWPQCIEKNGRADFSLNYLQLNSIAMGSSLESSFFSASCDVLGPELPGQHNFPVDKRGVIFSGKTREVIARGLTRPHSARFMADQLWVDNSGYGQVGIVESGGFEPVCSLEGWTRGLAFLGNWGIVGTSRVIPKFSHYAPGLKVEKSQCGVHWFEPKSGKIHGSLIWPSGNQIFAIDWLPRNLSSGFMFEPPGVNGGEGKRLEKKEGSNDHDGQLRAVFYAFENEGH